MAGTSLRIDLSGLTAGRDAVARVLGRLGDTYPLMDEIGSAVALWTDLRFEREQDPQGRKWRPLAPATLKSRRRGRGSRVAILQDSGRLRQSITHKATARRARVGSNLVYAAIHQFGGQAGRGRKVSVPARPYLGLSGDDEAEIGAIVRDFVVDALGAASGGAS